MAPHVTPRRPADLVDELTGEPVRVRFEVGEDIRFFKQRIAGLVGVPVLNQRLVCDGAELRRGTMTAANVGGAAMYELVRVGHTTATAGYCHERLAV